MLKNITLSAEAHLLVRARKKAQAEHTTLNVRFRQWLENYARSGADNAYKNLMEQLSYAQPTGQYSRDAMNER